MRTPHFEQKTSEFQLQKIGICKINVTNVVFGMLLTSELVYALWQEVPKLVYYRLICKPVTSANRGSNTQSVQYSRSAKVLLMACINHKRRAAIAGHNAASITFDGKNSQNESSLSSLIDVPSFCSCTTMLLYFSSR